jgi:2-polyprenyl-3-methyl-5-hydroxy-6-metoxy-1,4-benzoquinol methylase
MVRRYKKQKRPSSSKPSIPLNNAQPIRWRIAQFFERRWWRRYLRAKDKTAYLNWKKAYWRDFLQKTGLHPAPGQCVLDAGCGPAGIFTILDNQCVDALDPLLDRYECDLPHFKKSDYPHTRFFAERLEDFAPATPYDLVFCLNAINHVADLGLCFDRLAALTRPGGTLIVSVDAHRHAWLKPLFRAIPGDILHPHQYDLDEYRAMLETRGCRVARAVLLKREWIFDYWLLKTGANGKS